VQDTGAAVARAMAVEARVDLRPPQHWLSNANRSFFYAMLGDGELHAAKSFGGTLARDLAAIRFGFSNGGSSASSLNQQTNVVAVVNGGASDRTLGFAVNPSHWYRFVVKARLDLGTFDLSVYDLGTTHPDGAGVAGVPVASLAGLALASAPEGGLSALGFTGAGFTGVSPTVPDDPGLALADYVQIAKVQAGFVITVR
jgi:hypothetical protein